MSRRNPFFTILICSTLTIPHLLPAAETNSIISQIEEMAALGKKAKSSLAKSIAEEVQKNRSEILKTFLPKLKDQNSTEQQLAIYVWALGLTGDNSVVEPIKALYNQNKSLMVRRSCINSVADVAGKQAEKFILSALDETTNKDHRFEILNLLGQLRLEAALPKAVEVLEQDIKGYYWQSIFVFGKMGDKAVPFLLDKINNKNRNIRANSINVLGQWLIPPEAARPLKDLYWKEKDTELRSMILSSLERTIIDFSDMKTFFEQVADREKDDELVKYARETLSNLDKIKTETEAFAKKKKPSADSFESAYVSLYESKGRSGDYDTIGVSSTIQDEPKLKTLREAILWRNSDEAFYDYQKVNGIIMMNRWADKNISNKR